jgi:outer membrane receptor for ferrienterochelin and colicin
MKKPILAFLMGVGSLYSVQAQDSTAVESSETTSTEEVATEEDLFAMDFEDLLGMEVTSVSKKAERLQDVAASIYVVTSDDIAKSGATNLFEVLRTVPGFWGVQDSYNSVSSSIRNSSILDGTSGTVLYLLDGTPIQDQMNSTFVFSNFDIPLDEIDRIEVIRGSGGTVYGANSATGVVNIFTKDPEKYDGINVKVEGASSNYMSASV